MVKKVEFERTHRRRWQEETSLAIFQPKSFLKTLPTFAPEEVESTSVKMFHFFDLPSSNCVLFHRWPRLLCSSWDKLWRERNVKTETLSTCSYTRWAHFCHFRHFCTLFVWCMEFFTTAPLACSANTIKKLRSPNWLWFFSSFSSSISSALSPHPKSFNLPSHFNILRHHHSPLSEAAGRL